ncbi:MAG TPA: vanadium-dependent haloperoxidase [Longimicrobium sp.]|nr:vanadium-dependent haloperoxidase [Longimicrobium sp.]
MAKAHTLVDNFNDNSTDTAKWTAYGDPLPVSDRIRELNGRVEIRPASGGTGYSGYAACTTYDLTGSHVSVELVRAMSPRVAGEAYLSLGLDANNWINLAVWDGRIGVNRRVAGVLSHPHSVPYDPARHRWLRLREAAGVTYWETSADGESWEVLFSQANPFALTAVTPEIGGGTWEASPAPGVIVFDNFNVPDTARARRVEERRLARLGLREEAAARAAARRHDEHVGNDDELLLFNHLGAYSKGLEHFADGTPNPRSYGTLLRALQSGDPRDFEEIDLGAGGKKLTNPQAGFAFELEGADAQEITMPPAPAYDSEQTAHEAGELYWMAVARDVAFTDYGTNAAIGAAVTSLNGEFPQFGGTVPVTRQNVFRGIYPGEQVGPYVSQLLWKGNADPRRPAGQGRNALDGFVAYGSQQIDQRQWTVSASVDYLTDWTGWLAVQNGEDRRGQDSFDLTQRRFIRSLRDGANYVHFDLVIDAWYNAAWYLLSEPTTDGRLPAAGAVPMRDREFPLDPGNPYDPPGTAGDSKTQAGFVTFGDVHVLEVLTEVIGQAGRAVWWQKWGVHRRLRPEEYGGRIQRQIVNGNAMGIPASIRTSLQSGGLAPYFGNAGEKFPSTYLLPQAYPEGAPTHPAYGAGHATISGACATILKAFFDESKTIEQPVQSNAAGTALESYTGADAGQLTVGGEINKLAGNIAIFRNAAGVHWRSDYTESLVFGEAIAIRLLQELSLTYNEDDAFFELTKFDGRTIRIFDGKVVPVV